MYYFPQIFQNINNQFGLINALKNVNVQKLDNNGPRHNDTLCTEPNQIMYLIRFLDIEYLFAQNPKSTESIIEVNLSSELNYNKLLWLPLNSNCRNWKTVIYNLHSKQ